MDPHTPNTEEPPLVTSPSSQAPAVDDDPNHILELQRNETTVFLNGISRSVHQCNKDNRPERALKILDSLIFRVPWNLEFMAFRSAACYLQGES